jgi:hypothetical protein
LADDIAHLTQLENNRVLALIDGEYRASPERPARRDNRRDKIHAPLITVPPDHD